MNTRRKKLKIILAAGFLILLVLVTIYQIGAPAKQVSFGVNFSAPNAEYLGLPWRETYLSILTDLRPKYMRLMTYWETLEPQPGQFSFSDVDWMLAEAAKHNTKILLVVGHKQPRWPECHHPDWYNHLSPQQQQQQAILTMLTAAVNHFKSFSNITAWQVENESLFNYGENCPVISRSFLEKEVALVKQLDSRPIMLTDSGEKGAWLPTARSGADIFGATMYRKVYDTRWRRYIEYPLPTFTYNLKAGLVKIFSRAKKTIGSELQAEPWFQKDIRDTPVADQLQLMNAQIFADYVNYAKAVGFEQNYFWGVEWWYWLGKTQNNWSMWDAGKKVLQSANF